MGFPGGFVEVYPEVRVITTKCENIGNQLFRVAFYLAKYTECRRDCINDEKIFLRIDISKTITGS